MSKTILTQEDINQIINLYQTTIPSTHKLAEQFKVGHKKISKLLKNNNVKINLKGAQIKFGNSSEIEKSKTVIYSTNNENKKLIAVCKKTNLEFEDVNNLSGCLTRHIIEIYGEFIKIPNNTYQRKKYELIHNKKWFEEYFDIKEINKKECIKCGICDWSTEDLDNKTGSLTKHITNKHNLTITEYIKFSPKQEHLWNNHINVHNLLNNVNTSVICLECNKRFLGLTETHMLSEHNITLYDYKNKWGEKINIFSENTTKNLSELAIETNKNMINTFTSKSQEEIANYIKDVLKINIRLNDKKILNGVELDIFLPEHNLAIEFNGLYWHSEKLGKHKNYHLDKTIMAMNKEIKLIHIFEDEWLYKKEIVLSRLKHILGKSENKLFARKCIIKEIDSNVKDDFLNKTHIQGTDKSSIRLGAFINNDLVGVMTFSKLRKALGYINNSSEEYELVRFSSNSVIGLASKLLNYFIKNYKPIKIITYADRRWTPINSHSMYNKIGFKFINETKPNYWYSKKGKTREHRFNYRKDILVSKGFDKNKTEKEIMDELGYDRIWDCGSFKYELNFNK